MLKISQGGRVSGKSAGASKIWRRSCGAGLALTAAFGISACSLEQDQDNQPAAKDAKDALGSASQALTVSGSALLVVGNTTLSAGDSALKQRLTGLGLTVTVKAATAVTTADGTGKLVVISESVTSGDVNTKFRTSASPVVDMEPALFDDLAMTGTPTTEYGIAANQTSILLLGTPGSPVGDVTVPMASSAKSFGWGRPGANAKRVATLATDTSAATIFAYDKGASMVGLTAPARRVGWFATGDAAAAFNTSAWSLFDSSISWAAAPPVCNAGTTSCGTTCCTGSQVCVAGLTSECKTPDCSAANSCGTSDGAGGVCTNTKGKCLAKPNTTAACSGSSCVYACNAATLSCSTAADPACGSWNFESGTTEGWSLTNDPNSLGTSLRAATAPGTGAGARSLAVDVDGTGRDYGHVTIGLDFCGGAPATGLQGAFHASLWFQPTDSNGAPAGPAWTYLSNGSSGVGGGADYNTPANTWFQIQSDYANGANVSHVMVSVDGLGGHKGVLYFDNMFIN